MEDNDYTPIESKYYNYKGKNSMFLYLTDNINIFNKLYICAYKVNNTENTPFLNILLHKKKQDDILKLPEINKFKEFDAVELINYCKIYMFGLFMLSNLNNFVEMCLFNGFYIFENNLYMFFDISSCKINMTNTYSNSTLWFAIIDEIVNHVNVCNIKVDDNVKNLFAINDELCFLTDENNECYELPIIGFNGTTKSKVNFKYIFGEPIQNKNAILGPYYYFTDLKNVFKDEKNECIVRFVLFIGNVKYIENIINDPIDDSEIKKQRLKDYNLDQNMERLTLRISDHDGLWAESFDSVYLGQHTELDNGEYFKNTPIIVIKKYDQQIPLSYHYINKNTPEQYFIL